MIRNLILAGVLVYSAVLCFVICSSFFAFIRTRVPFVPTPSKDVKKLAEYLGLGKDDFLFELGSGNGRVAFLFEQAGTGRIRAFELGSWTYLLSLISKKIKKSNVEFVRKDFFKQPWDEATVVYCYLYPPLMRSIGDKVKEDLRPGSRVVSRDFSIPNLELIEKIKLNKVHDFFIYQV